jgi:glycerophosphoryl diester phosphodiesterase
VARAPLVIAHRGASGERPENTLSAYELAVEQRADMIEIDLHRTRDGAIVIYHDEDLAGSVATASADASLAEVRELDAGEGERVPTLDEVLDGLASASPSPERRYAARPVPGLRTSRSPASSGWTCSA